MNTRSLIATGMVCTTVVAVAGFLSNAGPLSPPAGPIAPTNKTLTEVEPRIAVNAANTPGSATALFVINQPGSYYLTGNITGVAGKNGIEITSSDVTLDLNGFVLTGAPGSGDGVFGFGGITAVVVERGTVAGWGGTGTNLTDALKSTIRRVRAEANGKAGMILGASSVIDSCVASGNVVAGIGASASCTISNSTAANNGRSGISASTAAVIVGCKADSNGLDGIVAGQGSHVSQCAALGNGRDGFAIDFGSVISGCSAFANGNKGIFSRPGVTIVANSAAFNAGGGIHTSVGSVVSNNTVASNTGDGIIVFGGTSTVTDNTAVSNTGDGIVADANSLIHGNTCSGNGRGAGIGAGIHILGTGSRVEGNTVTGNDRGIDVDTSGNFIVRNSASGNLMANYDVIAGNSVGMVVAAPASGAIFGSTGGAGVGTTDPWANFSF